MISIREHLPPISQITAMPGSMKAAPLAGAAELNTTASLSRLVARGTWLTCRTLLSVTPFNGYPVLLESPEPFLISMND